MSETGALEFRVEVWDATGNRLEELVALCSNSIVTRGAYDAARQLKPGANLMLRHRARIIERVK